LFRVARWRVVAYPCKTPYSSLLAMQKALKNKEPGVIGASQIQTRKEFPYHYRLTATITLAEISRQVGRRPMAKAPPARRPPIYDHRLARLAEAVGELVWLEELSDY